MSSKTQVTKEKPKPEQKVAESKENGEEKKKVDPVNSTEKKPPSKPNIKRAKIPDEEEEDEAPKKGKKEKEDQKAPKKKEEEKEEEKEDEEQENGGEGDEAPQDEEPEKKEESDGEKEAQLDGYQPEKPKKKRSSKNSSIKILEFSKKVTSEDLSAMTVENVELNVDPDGELIGIAYLDNKAKRCLLKLEDWRNSKLWEKHSSGQYVFLDSIIKAVKAVKQTENITQELKNQIIAILSSLKGDRDGGNFSTYVRAPKQSKARGKTTATTAATGGKGRTNSTAKQRIINTMKNDTGRAMGFLMELPDKAGEEECDDKYKVVIERIWVRENK